MFDVMFIRQKRNETNATHLNRAWWTIYLLGSKFKRQCSASLDQMFTQSRDH